MYCAHCGNQVQSLAVACPACGNPANGAPASSAQGNSTGTTIAIVIGAAFVVVAVVGIIAAIAIPNLLNAVNRARQKRTMADMRTIGTSVEAFALDQGYYPTIRSFDEMAEIIEPVYLKHLPRADGWQNSFEYTCWQEDPESPGCDNYLIASPARDGVFDLADLSAYSGAGERTRDMDCDIVYINGTFVQFPEGIQGR